MADAWPGTMKGGPGGGAAGAAGRWLAAALAVVALLLLAQIGWQTKWIDGLRMAAQPRMLPLVALLGILAFALPAAFIGRKRDGNGNDGGDNGDNGDATSPPATLAEVVFWLRPAEHLLWFMLYVGAARTLGYGPSTVLFCALLAWRVGCTGRQRAFAAVFGLCAPLFFKGALSVKIPGAAWYDAEFIPSAVRLFLALNF